MNHAKTHISLALIALLATGCAGYGGSTAKAPTSEADYKASLAEAKLSLKAAHESKNVWRDSGKILKKAEEAAKSGDFSTANKLALKAKRQGDLAVAQAAKQNGAGPL